MGRVWDEFLKYDGKYLFHRVFAFFENWNMMENYRSEGGFLFDWDG